MFQTELTAKEVVELAKAKTEAKDMLEYLKAMTEQGLAWLDKHDDILDCLLEAAIPTLVNFAETRSEGTRGALNVMPSIVVGILISEGIIRETP